ncbi:hypothetical protein ACJMK2_024958 [Sinanodonta woodiana]|uniref:Uncharacterized protein n=1 Tax=Sinanodonta woodiana TaxID=1069815 RepID=A0ABD3XIL7_SINWO
MLEPLVKTEVAIRGTLTEFKAMEMIEALDFDALKTLLKAMEPVKLAVENLSRDCVMLMSADTVVEFMFNKFSNLNNGISTMLSQRSICRPVKKNTLNFAGNIASRSFIWRHDVEDVVEQSSNVAESVNFLQAEDRLCPPFFDELNLLFQKHGSSIAVGGQDSLNWILSEFTLFRKSGQRAENVQKLYNAIIFIKPTSTDVERLFRSPCVTIQTVSTSPVIYFRISPKTTPNTNLLMLNVKRGSCYVDVIKRSVRFFYTTKELNVDCIINHPRFLTVCLDEYVLEAAYYTYRQQHGNRKEILSEAALPSCAVDAIKQKFPREGGNYTGFKHLQLTCRQPSTYPASGIGSIKIVYMRYCESVSYTHYEDLYFASFDSSGLWNWLHRGGDICLPTDSGTVNIPKCQVYRKTGV